MYVYILVFLLITHTHTHACNLLSNKQLRIEIEIENRATMERYNDASDGRRRRLKTATAAARTDRAPAAAVDAGSDAGCYVGVTFFFFC